MGISHDFCIRNSVLARRLAYGFLYFRTDTNSYAEILASLAYDLGDRAAELATLATLFVTEGGLGDLGDPCIAA